MANAPTVADFEALANNIGLIPMRFLKATITEFKGDIRGAEPTTALRWYNEGLAEPVKGIEPAASPSGGKAAPTDEETRLSGIAIGDNWAADHHLKRISLARQIDPKADQSLTAEAADKIIQAELARRAVK